MTPPPEPAAAVLQANGYRWQPAGPEDAPILHELASRGSNRILFNLPLSADEFALQAGDAGLRNAMLCMRGTEPIGAAAFSNRSHRNLNVLLICFFIEPAAAAPALALYVRHLFWLLPLHRVYAQLPLFAEAKDYVRALTAVGFKDEGIVPQHALIGGRPHDVVALGLLRVEFEAWCQDNEPNLSL